MVDARSYAGGKYFSKEDLPGMKPILLTIKDVQPELMGDDEEKLIMYFREQKKGLILNKTNINLLIVYFETADTDQWASRQVVLYYDRTVMFAGKPVGGLRVRPPRLQPQAQAAQGGIAKAAQEYLGAEEAETYPEGDLPF
jgi:hypothetical protein